MCINSYIVFYNVQVDKDITKRIIKAMIRSVALYAAETWTYKKEDIRRLEGFEMWVWIKMEKIWRDMKTNEEVAPATNGTGRKKS